MKFSASLALSSLAVVTATPIENNTGALQIRDVTASAESSMELFSQYSAAAYCSASYTASGKALACSTNNCPLVQAANATTSSVFQDATTGVDGYVAVDTQNSLIVLAFRGSVNVRNFIDDVTFLYTSCDLVSGCLVHNGFWTAWTNVKTSVLSGVSSAVAANPSFKLVVTGHSLGGAVATLAAAELRNAGTAADLYTYGSPRVGNAAFANFVTAQSGTTIRVTHTDDPVPRLPPLSFTFRHVSPEYWIEQGDYSVATNEIEVLPGIANTAGNAGQKGFNVSAHDYYFGYIAQCAGGLTFKRDTTEAEPAALILDEEYIAALGSTSLSF